MRRPVSPPQRHRWLDHWLLPSGEPLRALSDNLRDYLEGCKGTHRPRKRARKVADQDAFRAIVDITTANLALAVLDPPPSGALAVRLGKLGQARTRYDHPAIAGKQLPPTLSIMHESGFAELDVATRRGEVSSLRPRGKLSKAYPGLRVTLNHFATHSGKSLSGFIAGSSVKAPRHGTLVRLTAWWG